MGGRIRQDVQNLHNMVEIKHEIQKMQQHILLQ